ncbi:helix-turn-helix domain-containing protein [Cognatishimia sp. 1_MG-2023]|uniref:helix-turn-helix transcriptional regulator n=1 Tax=Cognatishimia sp. 1_MG-2023 TaxID=3062642 RepID=UPI0026E47BC8|nr:helix-turn-helix domain-containing protein [Cognatishimia sp. 1_MG-2023]MDO6728061.1 helix-turn-helix domain-containing protein [Cognatishimia sp. 1_MG-2023]
MSDQITQLVSTAAELGHAIRSRRKALKMTQEELAMATGVSAATVIAIEKGKETAQVSLVLQLCRDLGLRLTVGT